MTAALIFDRCQRIVENLARQTAFPADVAYAQSGLRMD
jgi:hypothetical protein